MIVKKKTTGIMLWIILICISSSLLACQQVSPGGFDTLSLNVAPPKVTIGEKATIEAVVRNRAARTSEYSVPLMVNGIADERKSITLTPEATETITYTLTKRQAGTYRISVGDKESVLEVEKPLPPDFLLSDLSVTPTEVDACQSVAITARIANIGGTEGTYVAELKVNGALDNRDEITIAAGADYTLILEVCEALPGTYTVAIGDLTGQFAVRELPQPAGSPPSSPGSPPPAPPTIPPNTCTRG